MKLTIATGDYAHTRPLRDARVEVGSDGVFDVNWKSDTPGTIFRRTFEVDAPFDIAEMSLATAWTLPDHSVLNFVALPVFPSRMCRLSALYVRNGIGHPKELAGGRIGVVRFGQTAAVWSRALLQHRYDIDTAGIEWWVAERQPFEPERVTIHQAHGVDELESMLVEGGLDCLIATSVPAAFIQGHVERLFPDWAAQEQSIYSETGSIPIMHTILMKRSLAEKHPQLPAALVRKFEEAKQVAFSWLRDTDATSLPIPLQHGWVEKAFKDRLDDPWPYGLAANRRVLDEFAGYIFEQGLTSRRIPPEEVFPSIS